MLKTILLLADCFLHSLLQSFPFLCLLFIKLLLFRIQSTLQFPLQLRSRLFLFRKSLLLQTSLFRLLGKSFQFHTLIFFSHYFQFLL